MGIPWVCILNRGHMSRNMRKSGPRELPSTDTNWPVQSQKLEAWKHEYK